MVSAVKLNRRKPQYSAGWKKSAAEDRQVLGLRCEKCGVGNSFENPIHRHHILAKSRRGPDMLLNTMLLCKRCHEFQHRRR